ncbi:putative transposase [Streptomyces sp. Ag82_O1-15]|nr:putative transposase [Streptomyces sp. Ag82_O1-15]
MHTWCSSPSTGVKSSTPRYWHAARRSCGTCARSSAQLREFNGEGDHVHLLVHYPPKIALSKLVNRLKGVSSRYLRAEYTGRINRTGTGSVFWSPSYFAGSCGGAPLSIVKDYIDSQKRPA